jgi:hypothetical protein
MNDAGGKAARIISMLFHWTGANPMESPLLPDSSAQKLQEDQ